MGFVRDSLKEGAEYDGSNTAGIMGLALSGAAPGEGLS